MTAAYYFAYGSNMNSSRLCERLSRAGQALLGRRHGSLAGYRLTFDKVSSQQAWVGYANIVPDARSHVEGTLNAMSAQALETLDAVELVPHHYQRVLLPVRDAASGQIVQAHAYIANPRMVRQNLKPTRDYIDHLLAAADVLPPGYLAGLMQVECWA